MRSFLLLLDLSGLGVVDDDLVDLLAVVLLLEFDLFVQSVQLLLQFLDGDFLELDLALELLVFVEKLLVLGREVLLLDFQLHDLLLQSLVLLHGVRLGLLDLVQQVLISPDQLFSRLLDLFQLGLQRGDFHAIALGLLFLDSVDYDVLFLNILHPEPLPLLQVLLNLIVHLVVFVLTDSDFLLQTPQSAFPLPGDLLHLHLVLLLHLLLHVLVLLLELLQLLIGLPQLLLMQAKVQLLVPLHLLVLVGGAVNLELQVPVLDHQFVALVFEFLQLAGVVLFPPQQLLQLFLQTNLHLGRVLSVLVQNLLQVLDDVLFGEVVNGVGFVEVKGVDVGRAFDAVVGLQEGSSCHEQFVFGDGVLGPVVLEDKFEGVGGFLFDFVSGQLHVEQTFVPRLFEFGS